MKIKEFVIGTLLSLLIAMAFIAMFALASLQQSYRYNPPTEAELEKTPALVKFIIGYGGEK